MKMLIAILLLLSASAFAANTPPAGFPGQVQTNSGNGRGEFGALAARTVSTGLSDTTTATDGLVLLQSGTVGLFTETVSAGLSSDQPLEIADGSNKAATYPVTLVAGAGATIGGQSSLTLSDNSFAISLKWDGVSNWVISSYYNGSKSITNPSYLLVNSSGMILSTDGTNFLRLF
jgi:hypothetical protein